MLKRRGNNNGIMEKYTKRQKEKQKFITKYLGKKQKKNWRQMMNNSEFEKDTVRLTDCSPILESYDEEKFDCYFQIGDSEPVLFGTDIVGEVTITLQDKGSIEFEDNDGNKFKLFTKPSEENK